jgi:hypothetical protein
VFSNLNERFQNFLNTRTGFWVALLAMAFSVVIVANKVVNREKNS